MNSFFTRWKTLLRQPWRNPVCSTAQISNYAAESSSEQGPDIRHWNKRISQLIRAGRLDEARLVFDEMPQRSTVTWNAMITGYVKRKEISKARKLFDEMPERDRDIVSWNLMISGYVSCHCVGTRYLEEGRRMFDRMPERDFVSWNTMISGYAKSGRMNDAICLFNSMPDRNIVSWNAMITGFLQNGEVTTAIEWYFKMPKRDAASLSALLSGLIQNGDLDDAARILLDVGAKIKIDDGEEDIIHAFNTLIAGYGQRGRASEARNLFDQIPFYLHRFDGEKKKFQRNVVSWNSMIMCYVRVGDIVSARTLFDQMLDRDTVSWNTMISGYVRASNMEQASNLFFKMPNHDTFSWNMMISGYSQVGNLDLALNFFDKMPEKNLVSWNSIISGHKDHGKYEAAIKLFVRMQFEGKKPDKHTISSVLGACAGLIALELGMQIHQLVTKTVIPDVPINNSLVTMYSRCGAILEARTIFDAVKSSKDVISWNAMIGGYASHGYAAEALGLLEAMKRLKVKPTYITFISILNACGHTGLVEEGRRCFESMGSEFGIEPGVEHFAALVDIMGRHGQLNEAIDLINGMLPNADKAAWGALLGACRIHNNVELARFAAEALMKLEPESSAPYVLLYNMYADVEQWENAAEVRKMLERSNIKKECASSWVDSMVC